MSEKTAQLLNIRIPTIAITAAPRLKLTKIDKPSNAMPQTPAINAGKTSGELSERRIVSHPSCEYLSIGTPEVAGSIKPLCAQFEG